MAIMDFFPQFGDNTNQTSDDVNLQAINLKRKLALADSLRNIQTPEGQLVSGIYVRPSWTQYLAGAVNQGLAGYKEREAMKEYGEALKSSESKKQKSLATLLSDLNPKPTEQTVMQPTEVDIQQGMNVPTSPYGTAEQVGMTSPYNTQNMQGQTNVMQPVTTQVPAQPLSRQDILGAVVKYGQNIGDNKIGEGAILDYVKQMYAPKKATWINMGDKQVQVDESGQPTGQTLPIGVSPGDVLHSKTTIRGQDLVNAREKEKLDPYHMFGSTSPANISKQTKSIKLDDGSMVNGTLDMNSGKYFVMQNGKKFWVEE